MNSRKNNLHTCCPLCTLISPYLAALDNPIGTHGNTKPRTSFSGRRSWKHDAVQVVQFVDLLAYCERPSLHTILLNVCWVTHLCECISFNTEDSLSTNQVQVQTWWNQLVWLTEIHGGCCKPCELCVLWGVASESQKRVWAIELTFNYCYHLPSNMHASRGNTAFKPTEWLHRLMHRVMNGSE